MSDDFDPFDSASTPHPSQTPPPAPPIKPPTPAPQPYQPAPSANLPGQYAPQPYQPQPGYIAAARPVKDRSLAVILEVLLGLFGFLGIGWIYAGDTNRGLITLVAFLIWNAVLTTIIVFTVGIGCICIPINWIIIAASAYALNNYTKTRPDLFGP
jgi:hypothetical protein